MDQLKLVTCRKRNHCARAARLLPSAGRGFGASQKPKKQDSEAAAQRTRKDVKVVTSKGTNASVRKAQQAQLAQAPLPARRDDGEGASNNLVEEIEFNQRLKALKAESEARRAKQQASAASGDDILGAARVRGEDIYADVQPLSRTLLPRDDGSVAKEYEGASFGPGQASLAAAAVLLGAIFLVTSGSPDPAIPARRASSTMQQQQQQLSPETRAGLEQQLATFTDRLQRDGGDVEALEAAGVLSAQLGLYGEAEQRLEQLAAATPGDADVLRLLAETQAAQGKHAAAASSYGRAWEASGRSSLEVLQGLTAALVADGKEAAAVDAVKAAAANGGSSGIGPAELQLLLAKTLAQWRGHAPDALAVYDGLIESRPEDFRAYLAKGLLLQDQGRAGDAQRYLIQARYYAGDQKALVDRVIAARQQQ